MRASAAAKSPAPPQRIHHDPASNAWMSETAAAGSRTPASASLAGRAAAGPSNNGRPVHSSQPKVSANPR